MTEGPEPDTVVVGVVADPDLPARLARDLARTLPAILAEGDDRTRWRVEVAHEPFEAMYPDLEHIIDKAARRVRDTSWDLALCLTDLPLRSDGRTVPASLDLSHRVALVAVPALGGVRLRTRLRELAAGIVGVLYPGADSDTSAAVARLTARLPFRHVHAVDDGSGTLLVARGGPVRFPALLAGMVRANRPWRLFVGLSSAFAGALTGTAFGVLYSNIWQLATALGPFRSIGVVLAAVAAMTVWIIAGHGLWERAGPGETARTRDVRLRNAGTTVTVAIGAMFFFAVLLLVTFAAVCLIIPPAYLSEVLGGPVHPGDYFTIAVMASAMGIVAGAIGSGLEDDLTVRKATYGYRERERRNWVARNEDRADR